MSQAILLFARAPSAPGKTRLTTGLSPQKARALREALLLDTLDVARSAKVPLTICYTPNDAHEEMSALVGGATLAAQRGDDLGARMHHAIADAFAAGAHDVVVLASDVPTLPTAHLIDTLILLTVGIDCVFGPADDGGYYLIGVTRGERHPSRGAERLLPVFHGIAWGTETVLSESLVAAEAGGLTSALIRPWFDVDVPADLGRVMASADQGVAARTRLVADG